MPDDPYGTRTTAFLTLVLPLIYNLTPLLTPIKNFNQITPTEAFYSQPLEH